MGLDHVVDLLLHRIQVEGSRILHRRVADGRLGQVSHRFLNYDETPELAGEKFVAISECAGQGRFAADHWEPLERILANIYERGHIGHHFWSRPTLRLLEKLELHVINAHRTKLGASEIEELMSLRRPFAREQVH